MQRAGIMGCHLWLWRLVFLWPSHKQNSLEEEAEKNKTLLAHVIHNGLDWMNITHNKIKNMQKAGFSTTWTILRYPKNSPVTLRSQSNKIAVLPNLKRLWSKGELTFTFCKDFYSAAVNFLAKGFKVAEHRFCRCNSAILFSFTRIIFTRWRKYYFFINHKKGFNLP